ncbi:hypothetical protein [Methylobacterium sp. V23]|uniref:hypothetical protein n=1 Tax=Methylobacterium sp. V23 TaxID=2044878 RepID=UPI000CDA2BC8|nr:hypothetical protein [Methylobacterium sp. V23]POR42665.1 hypothetical protein CRT23_12875 [Methylobacterium sp. V23]
MSANHPTFSASGPDATYTPATFNDNDGSYQKGVTPAVLLAGQIGALSVALNNIVSASTGYAIGDIAGLVTRYDAASKQLFTYWQNFTAGTLPGGAPAAGSYTPSPLMGLPNGENHLGAISGGSQLVKLQWNRPANTTPYDNGDLIGKTTTVTSPSDGTGNALIAFGGRIANAPINLVRARMWKSSPSLTGATFHLHFFEEVPTLTVGDNGVFNSTPTGTGGTFACDRVRFYAGKLTVTMDSSRSDGCTGIATPQIGSQIILSPAFGTKAFYCVIEAGAAYTPANTEAFGLTFEIYQD